MDRVKYTQTQKRDKADGLWYVCAVMLYVIFQVYMNLICGLDNMKMCILCLQMFY